MTEGTAMAPWNGPNNNLHGLTVRSTGGLYDRPDQLPYIVKDA